MNGINGNVVRQLERWAVVVCVAALLLAVIGWVGWILDVTHLRTIAPDLATMKANTALGLFGASAGLLIKLMAGDQGWKSRLGAMLGGMAALVGILTLAEYALHVDLHIDQLLGADIAPTNPYSSQIAGRMSVATATCISCVGLSVLMLDRFVRVGQGLALVTLAVSGLGLLGYCYGILSLYRVWIFSTMAVHTATAATLISLGVLMSRPRRCVHAMLTGSGPGSSMLRRLLPVVVVAPLLLGWLQLIGQWRGLYLPEFGTAMLVLLTIGILTGVIWLHAELLERVDQQRKRAEADRAGLLVAEQAARQRAEQAVAAREQLLSIVSHELRTPLTPVLLIATSLENRAQLPEDVAADLKIIREQVQVEARIIDDLLDLVGIHQGKLQLHVRSMDLKKLVMDTVQLFERLYVARQLRLIVDWQAGDCRVNGDDHRLQQVMRALLDNAMKFTPAGGCVTIHCTGPADGRLMLEVCDTGVGIPQKAMDRIFEPFEQADGSMTRKFGGMGIGLTICRRVIELHGGTILASSEGENKGATIRLKLPIDTSYQPQATKKLIPELPEVKALSRQSPLRLLLVEDNADTLRVLGRLLQTMGHKPTMVCSAGEALEALSKDVYDLMISDIGLPDESGWALMHRVRQKYPIRAIAISGFVDEADQDRSRAAGYMAHLSKPIGIGELEQAIATVTGEKLGDAPVAMTQM